MQRTKLSLMRAGALAVALIGAFAIQPARAATGREPVIVIPGVGGSEFKTTSAFRLSVDNGHGGIYTHDYPAGEPVWVNTWEALKFGSDDYFDVLKMQPDGVTPVAPALQVSDIYHSGYDDLIDYLQRQGYARGVDLWIFPYDWRADITVTAARLDALITQALTAANGGNSNPATWTIRRVDLVAHSMGGLVGRYYISDPARASRVDQLLTLGTPALGATSFLKTLVYGDALGPWILGVGLNPEEIKDVVQNMPGGFQLLPSPAYNTYYDNSPGHLRPWVEDRDIDGDGVARGVLSYEAVRQVLLNLGKNGPLLDRARDFHTALDTQRSGGVNGVRWSALVGTGYGTLGQMREYTSVCTSWFSSYPCPKRDEIPVEGDGSVAKFSAAMGDTDAGHTIDSGAQIWYVQRQHSDLVKRDYVLGIPTGDGPALAWIGDQLRMTTGAAPLKPFAAPGAAVADAPAPEQQASGLWLAALGPVAVQVHDDSGRTTGRERGAAAAAQAEVPETRHERLPGSEFAFIRRDAGYTVDLAAESAGSVDLKVRVMGGGKVERTAVYLGVALGERGRAQLRLERGAGRAASPEGWPALAVDADGDGVFEGRVAASAVLDERASADTTAPEITIDSPAGDIAGRARVRWHAADTGAGLLRSQAVIDAGTPGQRVVRNGQRLALSPGQHRLMVVALDRAGNASSQETVFTVR